MRSHEALQQAIAGKTIQHAQRQHKSSSLIHKWQEPCTDYTDSGTINPLDRVEMVIETAISLNTPLDQAIAPVQYLAERFGLVCISLPKDHTNPGVISKTLLKTIKEFGDLSREAAAALDDGRITKAEAAKIDKEWRELVRQGAQFVEIAKGLARK